MNNDIGKSEREESTSIITEQMLNDLRDNIRASVSEYRFAHILGVEKMAEFIGKIYLPQKIDILKAIALLHDITKEYPVEKHLQLLKKCGIIYDETVIVSHSLLHAVTAAALIPSNYPQFAQKEIISAVRWHTTGRKGMELHEKIIYLADYIEETRHFKNCIQLRSYFLSADFNNMSSKEKTIHLDKTLIASFDYTINLLISENLPISADTVYARNDLICQHRCCL